MNALHRLLAQSTTCLVVVTALICAAPAQQQPAAPPPDPAPAPAPTNTATPVDPKVHEAAVHLFVAMGLKEQLTNYLDTMVTQGAEEMKSQNPNLRPEFLDEWRKRMKTRLNTDDFVTVSVHAWEKHFTAEELDQFAAAATQNKEGKTPVLPDALKEKFEKVSPALQSEIEDGTTQIAIKLSEDVSEEILKEHPDWTPASAPKSNK